MRNIQNFSFEFLDVVIDAYTVDLDYSTFHEKANLVIVLIL